MEIILAHKTALFWVSLLSLLFFIFSLAALPWIVARIPEDYFTNLAADLGDNRRPLWSPARVVGMVLKNTAGMLLLLGGIIMLFVPGQGILTILAGTMLLDFPGKKKLILMIVSLRGVRRGANWIRAKRRVPPLRFPR